MKKITKQSELQVDQGSHVVKLGAEWCGPCKILEPTLLQLETEFSDIKFTEADVDEVPELAQKYRIKALPTTIFFKDGQEVHRVIGMSLIEPLRKLLRGLTQE